MNTHKIKLIFVGFYIVAVMIFEVLFSVQMGDNGNEKLRWVEHTNKVLSKTKDLLSAMKDTETGQRGYILTHDKTYLEPYYKGLIDADKSFKDLSELTLDNPNQIQRLDEIKKLMNYKFVELKETIKLHDKEIAIDIIKKNEGKIYMDKIRMIISSFSLEELELLKKRKKEFHAQTDKNRLLVRAISFSLLLILFYIFYINIIQKNRLKSVIKDNIKRDKIMQEQSRLAQMGEMLSMIAHQWRQPLNAISLTSNNLSLKCMMDDVDKEFFEKELSLIDEYSQHLSITIDDFRNFFKPNKDKVDVTYNEIIENVLNIVEVSIANKNINLVQSLNCKSTFHTYPNELKQVILNIIKNAEDVLLEKEIENPTITIETSYRTLTISDNGGGIPADVIGKIFDPYFSTKLEKNGTGLGLYMSKTIIEEHCDGKISVVNTKDGAAFIIELSF